VFLGFQVFGGKPILGVKWRNTTIVTAAFGYGFLLEMQKTYRTYCYEE